MTNQHSLTPPPELVAQWKAELPTGVYDGYKYPQRETELCIQAAQWGADQELEACCKWFANEGYGTAPDRIRMHRRPKPPSLKEQALALVNSNKPYLDDTSMDIIRKALEALPND
jgi:hypothetical protein